MTTRAFIPAYFESRLHQMVQVQEDPAFNAQNMRNLQDLLHSKFDAQPDFAGINGPENATLVLIRSPHLAGHVGTEVMELVQLPLYFQEVRNYTPLSSEAMAQRLQFARESGFLLFGRDETVAVIHGAPLGHLFCGAYEVNTDGVPRELAGIYADSISYCARLRHIDKLNATETEKAISETLGTMYWWSGQQLAFNPVQIERMRATIAMLEQHRKVAPPERTASGAVIERSFIENGSTASLNPILRAHPGWKRYSTRQDAWYYGIYVCEELMQTITYCEQDVSHVKCETREQFMAELQSMARFHGTSRMPSAMGYGEDGTTAFFESLYLMKGEARTMRFDTGQPVKDADGNWNAPLFAALSIEHPAVLALTKDAYSVLPEGTVEIDRLNPLAFELNQALAKLTDRGYLVKIALHDGTVYETELELQPEEA